MRESNGEGLDIYHRMSECFDGCTALIEVVVNVTILKFMTA
jgi:hypothetical protein